MPELIIPAFIAGLFTFLAPCTLPLVPGYLGFISGVSLDDLKDGKKAAGVRRKIFFNGLLYVLGFSAVFVLLGSLVGLVGGTLFAQYQMLLSRVGGAFVILFGIFMISAALQFYQDKWPWLAYLKLPGSSFLTGQHKMGSWSRALTPGQPLSSILFGAIFAVGWTPCVGPVLGAILTLAATGATAGQGALLLTVFSLGLATPFLVLAAGIGYFSQRLQTINKYLPTISAVGGIFIVGLGLLVLTNSLGHWINFSYQALDFINYERLYDFL